MSTVDSSQFTRAELPAVACRPLPSHQWLPHRHPLMSTLHCTDSASDGDSDSSEVDNSDSDCSYGGLFLASAEGFELEQRHSWPVVTEMVVTVAGLPAGRVLLLKSLLPLHHLGRSQSDRRYLHLA